MNLYNPLRDSIFLLILVMLTVGAYFLLSYMRGKRVTYFGNLRTLERTHGFRLFHVSSWILLVKVFIIVMLYMIATDTIQVMEYQPVNDTDYVLLIDSSSSMAKTDYTPNRLSSAKDISLRWLNILTNETAVGMISFSQDVESFAPLTFGLDILKEKIAEIEIDYSKSGTDLDYAFNYGADLFINPDRKRTMLLVTDGTELVTNETIQRMKENQIRIISFGIGSEEDEASLRDLEDVPEGYEETYASLDLNFTILEVISNSTGGKAYRVSNEIELEETFRNATLEQVEMKINSSYYIAILIALLSILELVLYAKLGAL